MRIFLMIFALLLTPLSAVAAEEAPPAAPPGPEDQLTPAPEPPQIPEAVQSGETLEPEITIVKKPDQTIEEYRINGQLFKVKITPSSGPAYYLIDQDGDGVLETRSNDLATASQIPPWLIFSW